MLSFESSREKELWASLVLVVLLRGRLFRRVCRLSWFMSQRHRISLRISCNETTLISFSHTESNDSLDHRHHHHNSQAHGLCLRNSLIVLYFWYGWCCTLDVYLQSCSFDDRHYLAFGFFDSHSSCFHSELESITLLHLPSNLCALIFDFFAKSPSPSKNVCSRGSRCCYFIQTTIYSYFCSLFQILVHPQRRIQEYYHYLIKWQSVSRQPFAGHSLDIDFQVMRCFTLV